MTLRLDPEIQNRMKAESFRRGCSMKEAAEEAFEAWLIRSPIKIKDKARVDPENEYHKMLAVILSSGDRMALDAVRPNIEIFYSRLEKPKAKNRP